MNQETSIAPTQHSLQTAVLFLVFNRIDTTKQVFEAIRQAKPPRLYIAADGARTTKDGEKEKVQAVRDYILFNIDWECEIKTLFREENLGCKYAVSRAITWFFENEEQGIILEDDCLPSQSFFWFCQELLEKYKHDFRIWHISGVNLHKGLKYGDSDYIFSKYSHVWGWATWANRWKHYDVELNQLTDTNFLTNIFHYNKQIKYWNAVFEKMKRNVIDTWDYQWVLSVFANNGLSITPQKNLVSNLGFGIDATHTILKNNELSNIKRQEIIIRKHPSTITILKSADSLISKKLFEKKPLYKRAITKLFGIFKFT